MSADIGTSIQGLSDTFFVWLPRLGAAIIILIVAWLVARVLRTLVRKLLGRFDPTVSARTAQIGRAVGGFFARVPLSRLLAGVVYWLILILGISLALNELQIPRLDDGIAAVWGYLPNVLAALVIVLVALGVANLAGRAIAGLMGDSPLAKIAATLVPILVLTVATFMALVQLRLAVQIVAGTYFIILGGIALGAALAFGLGGRAAAQRMLDTASELGGRPAP
jgi:mechanosensitive ion channel-like protein